MQLCRRDLLNINHVEGKIADEGLDYIDVKGNVKQIMFLYGLPPPVKLFTRYLHSKPSHEGTSLDRIHHNDNKIPIQYPK